MDPVMDSAVGLEEFFFFEPSDSTPLLRFSSISSKSVSSLKFPSLSGLSFTQPDNLCTVLHSLVAVEDILFKRLINLIAFFRSPLADAEVFGFGFFVLYIRINQHCITG